MTEEFEAIALKYKDLRGLSERQLSEHHDVLYAGYVKKSNEIRKRISEADLGEANASYSGIRSLKFEETFTVNGVKLHEGYFENLGGEGKPSGLILDLIEKDFGSFEAWKKEFTAVGKSARGWVVLAFDLKDNTLNNYLCDLHNQGGVWNCITLLILDVYEHAYFLDYATSRAKYIDAFFENINWEYVNSIVNKYKLQQYRNKT